MLNTDNTKALSTEFIFKMAYMKRYHPTKFLYEFLQPIFAYVYIQCSYLVGEEEEDAATYIPPSTSWSASLAR
jgi:hypothetical protein